MLNHDYQNHIAVCHAPIPVSRSKVKENLNIELLEMFPCKSRKH